MNRSTFFIAILYALTVIMLGIMGYQAGSVVSLVASLIIGIFILIFMFLALALKRNWPVFFALISVVAALSFFIYRFSVTKNFMPAVMAIFSALVAFLLTIWLASRKKI